MKVKNKGNEIITEHFKEPLKPGEVGIMLPSGKYDRKIQELFKKGILEKILYRNVEGECVKQKLGNVKKIGSSTVVLPPDKDKKAEQEAEKANEAIQDLNLNYEAEEKVEDEEESGEADLFLVEKDGVITLDYEEADKPRSLKEIKEQNKANLEEAKEELKAEATDDGEVIIAPSIEEVTEEEEPVEEIEVEETKKEEVSFEVEEDTSEDN